MQKDKLSNELFRFCMGAFVTGVTVVTAVDENGQKYGITVNSFNSVSLNPPLILFSLEKNSSRFGIYNSCSHFIVNLLSDLQKEISCLFAKNLHCDWANIEGYIVGGIPTIKGSIGYFHCKTINLYEGGDHTIILGEVVSCNRNITDSPLTYYSSNYHKLGEICDN